MKGYERYIYGAEAEDYARRKKNSTRVVRPVPMKKTVQINAAYVIMLGVVIGLLAFFSISYIGIRSDVTSMRKAKGILQNQYEEAKVSNDLLYENIMSKVDLKEIERIAVEELGMKMAGEGQICIYSGDIEDYVKQYSDIPK